MYIFDLKNKSCLKDILLENLKILGVRTRFPKKIKENEKENVFPESQIFQKPLNLLKKCYAARLDGSFVEIPEFLVDACGVIEKDITTEGIFRKAGSTCKQKERKLELNQGKKVNCEYHVLDACSLVKLFFRELPQPIIPYAYHDIFLKSLLLSTYEKELNALMLACLLLPEENLATLAFFMEFLLKVSRNSDKNKMTVKNLAIILTPTLMPMRKGSRPSESVEMTHHFKVVEMLIENAEMIGKVPEHIVHSLSVISGKKSKKKRRSGSITRMLTGLKKMVGGRGSATPEWNDSVLSTPDSFISAGKRKNSDPATKVNLSAKKKRFADFSPLGAFSPLRCRMHGYVSSVQSIKSPICSLKKSCDRSPGGSICLKESNEESGNERQFPEGRHSRLSLMRRCTTKKQKSQTQLTSTCSLGNLFNVKTEKSTMERKHSTVSWGSTATSSTHLLPSQREIECSEKNSNSDFITVPKTEYEEIKSRVSALEEDLEILNKVHSIQTAYEKTLEEAERLSEISTEFLSKRLSRELKIRRSSENKVIRSPSARKIGSIRRRSKESTEKFSETRSNLRRGRPNTLLTGLPSPRLRTLSNEPLPVPRLTPLSRSATFRERREEWRSGEIFFGSEQGVGRLSPSPQGRPSLAEIRCQNAGMVLEKAKLFNSWNESNGCKLGRRQSVRLENMRRINQKQLTRTRSHGSDRKPKTTSLLMVEEVSCTPKIQRPHVSRRDTPSIKKSLLIKSPRTLGRTPLKSAQRSRATPMKVLMESEGTPHIGLRRSPRILARSINTPIRLKD